MSIVNTEYLFYTGKRDCKRSYIIFNHISLCCDFKVDTQLKLRIFLNTYSSPWPEYTYIVLCLSHSTWHSTSIPTTSKMGSVQPSDTESNMSDFVKKNDKTYEKMYLSVMENMDAVNQQLIHIENNLKRIIQQSGPLESQLCVLLHSLPKPNLPMSMETD